MKRGVQVTAVLDKVNRSDKYSAATFLKNQGATVLIDDKHGIAHDKIILIDDDVVITASFNFTKAAEEPAHTGIRVAGSSSIRARTSP